MQNLSRQSLWKVIIIACFLFSCFAFTYIAFKVFFHQTDDFDKSISVFVTLHSTVVLMQIMGYITFFGSSEFLLPAYIILIAYLLIRKKFWYAVYIAIIALSGAGLISALKQLFHRERPGAQLIKGIMH